jgi:hypothetical protein
MPDSMTVEQANERLRAICIEALDIASGQGWDWTLDAYPHNRPGWMFVVYTDRVRQPDKRQLPLMEEPTWSETNASPHHRSTRSYMPGIACAPTSDRSASRNASARAMTTGSVHSVSRTTGCSFAGGA